MKHSIGPLREYTVKELELFAQYREQRAIFRPWRCISGEKCWVEKGPPAITRSGRCIGCAGLPRLLRELKLPPLSK